MIEINMPSVQKSSGLDASTSPHEAFLAKNKPVIDQLFPNLVDPKKPQPPGQIVQEVTTQVWDLIQSDPVVTKLGKEGFDILQEHEKLSIIERALNLLKANDDAAKYLADLKKE